MKLFRNSENIALEGTMSQIIYLGPSYNLFEKTGNFYCIFSTFFFKFYK